MLGTLTQCFGGCLNINHNPFKDFWMFYRMCPTNTKNGCAKCSIPVVEYRSPTPDEDGEYERYCRTCFYNICFYGVVNGKFPEGATMQDFREQLVECQLAQ